MLRRYKQKIKSLLRKMRSDYLDNARVSHAQCGEDLILRYLFDILGIKKVTYLDIGAHHPGYLSNTYLFYLEGGHGVCVEPDPSLTGAFKKMRPRDITLNCGVGIAHGEADFFIMSIPTLNTFSREEAERYQAYGNQHIVKTLCVELKTVQEILEHNFGEAPNLVSLDVEGLDYAIMQEFDFARWRPQVFCLETLTYTEDKSERKVTELIELMQRNGYMIYADTYINTIFVDERSWKDRVR